jgi:hypothetical protein
MGITKVWSSGPGFLPPSEQPGWPEQQYEDKYNKVYRLFQMRRKKESTESLYQSYDKTPNKGPDQTVISSQYYHHESD